MEVLSTYVKTPQLIGIIAGCAVFTVTIAVVIYLLAASGSLSKLAEELHADVALKIPNDNRKKGNELSPQFGSIPELYDDLIRARKLLPLQPDPPSVSLKGRDVNIRKFQVVDQPDLTAVSDGRAIFHESSYDPARIWGWFDKGCNATQLLVATDPNSQSFVIVDTELNKAIGMFSLIDNCPSNLSVQIG